MLGVSRPGRTGHQAVTSLLRPLITKQYPIAKACLSEEHPKKVQTPGALNSAVLAFILEFMILEDPTDLVFC